VPQVTQVQMDSMVPLETQEQQVLLEVLAAMDSLVPLANRDLMEALVQQVLLGQLAQLVLQELVVQEEDLGHLDLKVHVDLQDFLDQQDLEEALERQVSLDQVDSLDHLDQMAALDSMETLGQLGLQGSLGHLVLTAIKVSLVQMDSWEELASQDQQETQVSESLVHLARLVHLDSQDPLDQMLYSLELMSALTTTVDAHRDVLTLMTVTIVYAMMAIKS